MNFSASACSEADGTSALPISCELEEGNRTDPRRARGPSNFHDIVNPFSRPGSQNELQLRRYADPFMVDSSQAPPQKSEELGCISIGAEARDDHHLFHNWEFEENCHSAECTGGRGLVSESRDPS